MKIVAILLRLLRGPDGPPPAAPAVIVTTPLRWPVIRDGLVLSQGCGR